MVASKEVSFRRSWAMYSTISFVSLMQHGIKLIIDQMPVADIPDSLDNY